MFLDVYTFKHLQQPKCWSQKCRLALIRGGCIETWTWEKKRGVGCIGRRSFQDLPSRFAQLSRVQTEFDTRPLIPTYGPRIAAFTSNCNFDQLLAVLDYFFSFLDWAVNIGNAVISWSQNIVHCANLFQNVIDPLFVWSSRLPFRFWCSSPSVCLFGRQGALEKGEDVI